ncbi:MAG: hypothetical protein IKH33_03335 [Bacteroidales bacterium]|nr:hypothetical protein [Bacteroidales bacterium]
MKTKKQYTTPIVKVVAFKVEEVFQSPLRLGPNPDVSGYNDKGMQTWNTGDNDNNNNSLFERW